MNDRSLPASSGQTLVIVIVAMAVSLAAGLAISSRSLTALKGTSYSSQSTSAYHAAEAGVEEALKWLADAANAASLIGPPPGSHNGGGTLTGASYTYSIVVGGGGTADYPLRLDKDKTQEIKLNGVYGAAMLTVCWDLEADPGEDASLEMLLIAGSGEAGYRLEQKVAVNGGVPRSNGFEITLETGGDYGYCRTLTGIPGDVQLLRIKALYNHTSAVVKPSATLPPQAFIINSEGRAGEAIRKLEVTKSLPALPEIFDFAIFTPEDLTK